MDHPLLEQQESSTANNGLSEEVCPMNGHSPAQEASHNRARDSGHHLMRVKSLDSCRVCGDGPARMHYGVPTCFGCKGFFRRTLKRTKEYTCRYSGNCVVDRYERNSCRFCRFKRCLEVGMDPKAVRPDRDAAGRTHPIRRRVPRNSLLGANGEIGVGEHETNGMSAVETATDEWIRKLPVEMRTLLIQIMNVDAMVSHGDTHECARQIYPLPFQSIRQMLEDPSCLDGKRTEIRYEPYSQVEPEQLTALAHRRLIATVDTIDHLCALMDLHGIRDRVTLVKAAFAPLTLFCAVSATARVTRNRDILCLCNFGYVPRGAHVSYAEPYHFANRLVDRALDELVEPFRTFNFKEQEIVLMKAIVALNPYLSTLSTEAAEQVADFRDRVQETLYNVVRESHPKEVASSRFGNLLLFLPNIMMLASVMIENLQFIQSFRHQEIGPLLSELLEDADGSDETDAQMGMAQEDAGSSEESMHHSQSASSICSMTSSGNGSELFWQHTAPAAIPRQYSAGNIGSLVAVCPVPATSSSCSSLGQAIYSTQQQQLTQNDSDPDYNVTLTAETLKQAIQQQMEVDSPTEQQMASAQKPQFFIDPCGSLKTPPPQNRSSAGEQQFDSKVIASSKHVFTVEKAVLQEQQQAKMMAAGYGQQQQLAGNTFTAVYSSPSSGRPGQCPPFEEEGDAAITFLGARQQHCTSQAISKSQSYPFVVTGTDNGMSNSASHDHFRQTQKK